MQTTTLHNILALDVGERRVGIARANSLARLANPLITLQRDDSFWPELQKIMESEQIHQAVIGLPRNLEGNDTAQTQATNAFVAEFGRRFDVPVALQDEALTSRKAKAELQARGKPFAKADIDALAATYILEDYLAGGES
jgi:putative Holliday junction resolvase